MRKPWDAIDWGTCGRCGESEEDHEHRNDGVNDWFLCPTAFTVVGGEETPVITEINWDLTYDEERAGDAYG